MPKYLLNGTVVQEVEAISSDKYALPIIYTSFVGEDQKIKYVLFYQSVFNEKGFYKVVSRKQIKEFNDVRN